MGKGNQVVVFMQVSNEYCYPEQQEKVGLRDRNGSLFFFVLFCFLILDFGADRGCRALVIHCLHTLPSIQSVCSPYLAVEAFKMGKSGLAVGKG